MERWTNKVALVTGATSGIGKSIATELVKHGMKVVACGRNEERLNEITATLNKDGPGRMFPIRCDLSKEDEILSMFDFIRKEFGNMHVCVNNAGLFLDAPLLSGSTEKWKTMFDVNVIGLSICTRESVKLMNEGGVDDGHVININSLLGHTVGGNSFAYCATKFAVTALTEGLRQELRQAKSHIRSTSISPSITVTEAVSRAYGAEIAKTFYSQIKCLEADDIANSVVYALGAPAHVNVSELTIRPVADTY